MNAHFAYTMIGPIKWLHNSFTGYVIFYQGWQRHGCAIIRECAFIRTYTVLLLTQV